MKKEVVKTTSAAQPGGWYSQAIRANNFIFVSGITGVDPSGGQLVARGDIAAQTRQAIRNMANILEAGGSSLDRVVKTTVFIDDIDRFDDFNKAYKEFFVVNPPARSTVQVGRFSEGLCVEIEAIAICN